MRRNIIRFLALFLVAAVLAAPVSADAAQRLAVERQVYDFLVGELKLTNAAACGVLANIEHESSFQPTIYGDQGTSYGLCQWHNERFSALRGYCASLGLDHRTVEGQLAYLRYELGTQYSNLLLVLKSIENTPDGAYRAAYLWCVHFEKPSDTVKKAMARGELARDKYWVRYSGYAPITGLPPEEDPETVPQEIIGQLLQQPVAIPQAPQEQAGQEDLKYFTYIPRNLPRAEAPAVAEPAPEPEPEMRWEYPALALIAAAMAAVVFCPEKKKPAKGLQQGAVCGRMKVKQ